MRGALLLRAYIVFACHVYKMRASCVETRRRGLGTWKGRSRRPRVGTYTPSVGFVREQRLRRAGDVQYDFFEKPTGPRQNVRNFCNFFSDFNFFFPVFTIELISQEAQYLFGNGEGLKRTTYCSTFVLPVSLYFYTNVLLLFYRLKTDGRYSVTFSHLRWLINHSKLLKKKFCQVYRSSSTALTSLKKIFSCKRKARSRCNFHVVRSKSIKLVLYSVHSVCKWYLFGILCQRPCV